MNKNKNRVSVKNDADNIIIFKLTTDRSPAIQKPLPKSKLAISATTTQLRLSKNICIKITTR